MYKKKSWFIPNVLILCAVVGVSAAKAGEDGKCYTEASLKGTYAVVATYGANVALALALRQFDRARQPHRNVHSQRADTGVVNGRQDHRDGEAGRDLRNQLRRHWNFDAHGHGIQRSHCDPNG